MAANANYHAQIHLKMLDRIQLAFCGRPCYVATTNDELYIHCSFRDDFINVFDRSNLREVKHVIQTDDYDIVPRAIVACNQSKCVYVLNRGDCETKSVMKISKDAEQQFDVSPWIGGMPQEYTGIAVTASGSLILSRSERPYEVIDVYNMDGTLQRQMRFPLDLFYVSRIISKPSGNFVLVSTNYEFKKKLTEIDMDGNIVHQYQSSLLAADAEYADSKGRHLIVARNNKLELLDSELNPLDVTLPKESDNLWAHPIHLHYDRLRNEVLVIEFKFGIVDASLSVFTFTEEDK